MVDVTIEVKKKEKDEEFKFEDLEMYHEDCYGGRIKIEVTKKHEAYGLKRDLTLYKLTCTRCGREIYLDKNSNSPADIIKTSIDEEERTIEGFGIVEENPNEAVLILLKILVKIKKVEHK
jgi:hypothetical protein